MALTVLIISARPADKGHQYGHTKAEYFSAVTEGAMIFVAAGVIIVSAALRFFHPKPLESIGIRDRYRYWPHYFGGGHAR